MTSRLSPAAPRAAFPQTRAGLRALLAALSFPSAATLAQTAPADPAPAQKDVATLATVEVTGDRIQPFTTRNVDLPRTIDDVQPYYFFDAATIDRSGANSVEEFIRQKLTMNTASANNAQSFFIGGTRSSINLRGLGDGQTLVLINGRRAFGQNFAVNGGGTQPDLSGVPLGAIDRIEVLPTTSSAIYGSNAVGGVVNVVLKRKYSGGEVKTTYQNPDDTHAPIRKFDVNYGFSVEGGRTQVMLIASYSDQQLLKYQDRPFMRRYDYRNFFNNGVSAGTPPIAALPIVRSSAANTNLVLKSGGNIGSNITYVPYGTTPATPAATLSAALRANAGTVNTDLATYSRQIRGGDLADIGTASRLKSVGFTARREMTPRLDAHLEFSTTSAIATRNMSISSTQAVPATAPSNPFTTAVTVYLPIDGFWPVWSDNVTRRFVAGFTYKLPHQWTAQGDYSWTRGTNSFYSASSTLATADITNDLNSGKLNPFLDTTLHRFDLQPYSGTQSYFGPASTNNVALRASGPVWRLPAGAPTVTVGLETRQEGYGNAHTYITYPNFPARDTYSVAIGKRQSTRSAYTEVQAPVVGESNRLPLVYQLDFQAAGRAEDFTVRSGTSSINVLPAPATAPVILNNTATYRSNNPTAGLRYRPVDSLMFRVSHARGFVAPSYSQLALNTIPAATPTTIADPRRGGLSYPVSTVSGGNPDLTPERSQSWNLGLVFDPRSGPLKGLRASVEYYVIRKQNNIGALSAQTLIENESLFPDRITRSAPPAGDPFGVGPITLVNTASLNLLKSFLEGFDFNLTYRRDTARFGNFLLSALASMPNHVKRKTTFGQPYLDYANYVSQGQIRLNGNASLSWDWRQWSAGWTTRYVSRFLVPAPPVSTSTASITSQGGRYVPAQSYSDVFVAYRFHGRGAAAASRLRTHVLRDTEIQFGVSNLFKKTPPYDVASFGSYYYSTWGDIRWRDLRLSLKRTF